MGKMLYVPKPESKDVLQVSALMLLSTCDSSRIDDPQPHGDGATSCEKRRSDRERKRENPPESPSVGTDAHRCNPGGGDVKMFDWGSPAPFSADLFPCVAVSDSLRSAVMPTRGRASPAALLCVVSPSVHLLPTSDVLCTWQT